MKCIQWIQIKDPRVCGGKGVGGTTGGFWGGDGSNDLTSGHRMC